MPLSVKPIEESGVVLKAEGETVTISGNIEIQEPGRIMSPFFKAVHEGILSNNIKAVRVDITKLDYLNSSGIKEIVDWVMKLDELPENKKYQIKFICNPNALWQETSISTIEFLNTDFIAKEFI